MPCRESELQFHLHAYTRLPLSFFSLSSALYPKLRSIYRDEIRHRCFLPKNSRRKFTSWTVTFSNVKCRGSCLACIISRIPLPAIRPGILSPLVSAPRGQMHSLKYLLDHASRNKNAATEHASRISLPKFWKIRDFLYDIEY